MRLRDLVQQNYGTNVKFNPVESLLYLEVLKEHPRHLSLMDGNCFLVTDDGWALTTAHQLENITSDPKYSHISKAISLSGDSYALGEYVVDERTDLALLKIEGLQKQNHEVNFTTLGNDRKAQIKSIRGKSVHTDTFVVETGRYRPRKVREKDLQEIRHSVLGLTKLRAGQSGSPILNLNGDVVGVAAFGYDFGLSGGFGLPEIEKLFRRAYRKFGD